jgi:serine/threonine protein kinase
MAEALQKIDRFELISRLGVGGFGTVWKARDTGLDRTVAVKIPRHGQLTDAEMEQFFREARSVAQLRHPNSVPVHDVGREGDAVFIVSDLIRGVSLADLLTGKRPTPRESAELCITIAKALDHAHRKGVIHRDLKPSNVMIDGDGTPYLMDFGLAKREAEEVTMTTDGQIIGTPAYMSPEQAAGQSDWVDRRTDIYSLGVILFELITGELPFRGNAQMQVQQRLNEDAPNARILNSHLHKDLATICAKCLEREPGQRYPTAKDVAEELSRYLEQLPIKARPLSLPGRVVRWAIRRPMQAVVAGLVLFLAVAGPMTALLINRQRSRLADFVEEQANLIAKREQENRQAIARSSRLQDQLDIWEGRANPWKIWPPQSGNPPKRRELASLLAARGAALSAPIAGEARREKVQRLLALATLYEAADDREKAERQLLDAADELEDLRESRPRSTSLSLALAECYDRLSLLSANDDLKQANLWLEKSVELRRSIATDRVGDPLLQAYLLDAELRSAAAAGFESAQSQLAAAQQLDARMDSLWPDSPAEIYRLACLLAGRHPWLDAGPITADGSAKAATD